MPSGSRRRESEQNRTFRNRTRGRYEQSLPPQKVEPTLLEEKQRDTERVIICTFSNGKPIAATRRPCNRGWPWSRKIRSINRQRIETLDLNDFAAQYGILQRELDTNGELYIAVTTRIKDMAVTSGGELTNLSVIVPAEVPSMPAGPQPGTGTHVGPDSGPWRGILGLNLGSTCSTAP